MMKKLIVILAVILISMSLGAEVLTIENSRYSLSFNTEKETYSFSIDGTGWPLYAQKDNIGGVRLKGSSRVRAQSVFSLVAIDTSLDKRITLNSKVADSVTAEKTDDSSLLVSYSFDEGITIPLCYTVTDNGLNVTVDTLDIKEEAPLYVFEISLFPCFSSSSLLDDGWFLVPDGEGALLRFNSGRSGSYNEYVYGSDRGVSSDVKLTDKDTVRLPLFGVSRNGKGVIVTADNSSAAMARITAQSSSSSTPYNSCYFTFVLRSSIEESISSDASQIKYEEERAFNGTISLLITGTEDSLVSMADTFSTMYISDNGGIGEDFILNWTLSEREKVKILGVPLPFSKASSVMSYSDVLSIVDNLSTYGTIMLDIEGWNSDEVFLRHVDSLSFVSSAGNRRDREKLFSSVSSVSLALAPNYQKSLSSRTVKDLSQRPSAVYDYLPASAYMDKTTKRYLVRPDRLDLGKLVSSTETLSFKGIGDIVYSDYNSKNALSRADYTDLIRESLEAFGLYYIHGGSFYSLGGAGHVFDASGSSSFNVLSEPVPFYQMVLSGKITYSYGALNTSSSPTGEILHILETGAVPVFELRNTVDEEWIENTLSDYIDDFRRTEGKKIVSYTIVSDSVRETVYENGTKVRVDYESGSYTLEGGAL